MSSGVFVVFHIESEGVPNGVELRRKKGTKKSPISLLSIACVPPSLPLFLCLPASLSLALVSTSLSFPSWQLCYVIFVCFSLHWQFLQWSKLDCIRKWRQLSVAILRDVFALLQRWRTMNPWHPPFLSPPPPPLPTISFRHSDCLLRLFFFLSLSDSIWHRHFLKCMCLPLAACTYPSYVS